jgi:hypothetical protein
LFPFCFVIVLINVRAGLPAVSCVAISLRAPPINFDSAKVECDYAIESCFLNRIFNRKAKTLESPVFICEKIFSIKKVRLALIAQSHSSIAF